ncbi:hypothetical protein ACWCO0_17355 [Streptomyces tubercidicus]
MKRVLQSLRCAFELTCRRTRRKSERRQSAVKARVSLIRKPAPACWYTVRRYCGELGEEIDFIHSGDLVLVDRVRRAAGQFDALGGVIRPSLLLDRGLEEAGDHLHAIAHGTRGELFTQRDESLDVLSLHTRDRLATQAGEQMDPQKALIACGAWSR